MGSVNQNVEAGCIEWSNYSVPPEFGNKWIWNNENGHYYLKISGNLSNSEKIDVSVGAHVVIVNDMGENMWLSDTFSDGGIGFNDVYNERDWEWIRGEKSDFTHWGTGQPDNLNGIEDAANLTYQNKIGYWCDTSTYGLSHCIIE